MAIRKIWFTCYDHERHVGGQKDTYRHAEAVAALGWDASIVHRERTSPLSWFDSQVPVTTWTQAQAQLDEANDVIVLPEDQSHRCAQYPGWKVIFNKNVCAGFSTMGREPVMLHPCQRKDVLATLVMSDHNKQQLEYACPGHLTMRVLPAIDRSFAGLDADAERDVVLWVPKQENTARTIKHLVECRGRSLAYEPAGVQWRVLEGIEQRHVAELMAKTIVLLFVSAEEGLGRTPIEALEAGAAVAGFRNGTLHEVAPPDGLFEWGDCRGVSEFIITCIKAQRTNRAWFGELQTRGLMCAERFSRPRYLDAVLSAWQAIDAAHAARERDRP
ncbi:hypothetical protein [Luteitalea sp.]